MPLFFWGSGQQKLTAMIRAAGGACQVRGVSGDMRLIFLCAITMIAFAANSILNRVALSDGASDAVLFGVVRLLSGAVMLAALVQLRGRTLRLAGKGRMIGVAALLVYIFGFSIAYESLDAGLGALILFGMVQITMFAGSALSGERPGLQRVAGACLAFGGLIWLLWPGHASAPSPSHASFMALAGIAWGLYSLNGRSSADALGATAANFVLAAGISGAVLALAWALPTGVSLGQMTAFAVGMACLSGAITSGLGYALWYSVLPHLRGSTAAVTQLTVPVIAIVGGAVLLAEPVGIRLLIASVFVLGGVLLAVTARQ